MSEAIYKKVISLPSYFYSKTLLCYVSTENEVDTLPLITAALKSGKKVAVPRCVEGEPIIEFYFIRGLNELEYGSYGLLEPPPLKERKYRASGGLCILPGLAFDRTGCRLGYGKGYYDRFLQNYKGITVGVCFAPLLSESPLPKGKFDVPVSMVVTDREIIICK
jgi:5-formyltetrahydrofolate cyclo-ligase